MKLLLLIACFSSTILADYVSYDGYKVYSVTPKTQSDTEFLAAYDGLAGFDFWEEINKVAKPIRIMVAPSNINAFEDALRANKMTYNLIIDNVEK